MNSVLDQATIIIITYFVVIVVGIVAILKIIKNKTKNVSTLRLFVQVAAVVGIFMGLLIGPFGTTTMLPLGNAPRDNLLGRDLLGTPYTGGIYGQFPDGLSVPVLACFYPSGRTITCPIWQLQAYIFPFWNANIQGYLVYYTTTGLEKLAIVIGSVIILSIVLGRFFCGWICPMGLYMDLLTRLRKITGKRHLSMKSKSNERLKQFSYIIIVILILLSVIFGSQAIFGTQLIPGTDVGGPQGTEAGITGSINEPFCLVCPVRPLCVFAEIAVGSMKSNYVFNIISGPLGIVGFYVSSINITILILITILAIAYRRFWCRICPLGALTALFSSYRPFKYIALTKLQKNESACTKCGVCKRVCPPQVEEVYKQKGGDVTVANCILCYRCVEMCPEKGALKAEFAGKTIMQSRSWLPAPKNTDEVTD
jgi:ferredoxin-type protein NapH